VDIDKKAMGDIEGHSGKKNDGRAAWKGLMNNDLVKDD